MGQEFAFVFDIIIIAAAVGMTFVGIKKGFARIIIEMLTVVLSFALAFFISEPIANGIYSEFVQKPLESAVDEKIGGMEQLVEIKPFGETDMDFDKIKISDVPVNEIVPDYEGTGAAVMDLSDVDFTGSGIEKLNLSFFGVKASDFSSVNAKTANFSMTDIETHGIGKLVTAHYLATCMAKSPIAETIGGVIDAAKKALPIAFNDAGTESVTVSSVRTVVLAMIDTKSSAKTALMDGIISPACTIIIRSIVVILLFIVFTFVFGIIARASGFINKIPVIGKINSLLGGIAGLLEAAIIIVVFCLMTKLISSMFAGDVILFNDTAINSTFLFKHIYNLDFLSF
ncbi:MAG: CvpA family protein [Oscillospiraceae bacterium]|nr:CvpA family protein [Oscillospiraceae bacterium]